MNKQPITYLSGRINGLPRWYAFIKFGLTDLFFWCCGQKTWNPMMHLPKNVKVPEQLKICSEGMKKCDFIYFQRGWKNSAISTNEFRQAAKLGLIIINLNPAIRKLYNSVKKYEYIYGISEAIQLLKYIKL